MNRHPHHGPRGNQSGVVLMIGMVLLLMITLMAVGVIRLSTRHTQVANNDQTRTEATAAANYALDMVLSTPATTWSDLRTTTGRVMPVNLGIQQTADSADASVSVTVKNMTCKRARILKNSELVKQSADGLSYVSPTDTSCFGGGSDTGLTIVDTTAVGSGGGNSNCGTVLFDVEAEAAGSQLLNAKAQVVQGVEVRTDITTLSSACG
jgi:Tfp pilus assembly protein PilX